MATADTYYGPYVVGNENVWPDMKIEDFYLFKSAEGYHLICEDNVGGISGHVRWGRTPVFRQWPKQLDGIFTRYRLQS